MKKQNRVLLVLLFIMVLVIGCYFAASRLNWSAAGADTEKTDKQTVLSADTAEITSFSYQYVDEKLDFEKKDGTWSLQEHPEYELDSGKIENLLSAFRDLKAQEVIAQPKDIAQYGLEQPVNEINLTLQDGTAYQILVGNEIELVSGRYIMLQGDDNVYVVATGTMDTVFMNPENLQTVSETQTE